MQPFQTVLISGASLFVMSLFTAMAQVFVNRYMPKMLDHVEKKIKEK